MYVAKFTKEHYPMLIKWWSQYGWTSPDLASLPTTGYVINNVCAGFVYMTDSNIAWIEWIISDKRSSKELREESLNVLIPLLIQSAKNMGFHIQFTSTSHKSLTERYVQNGFQITDTQMFNLIRSA